MRLVITLGTVFGMTLAALQPIPAQELSGNPISGRDYTIDWCSDCHPAKASANDPGLAADFTSIAKKPSTTALSLRVFFQSSHDRMPDFLLKTAEADDIIAYILSLKRE